MDNLLSPLVGRLNAYVPGEQPADRRYIKLNTNENPYPPSRRVQEAVQAAAEDLPRYPPPEMESLRDAIARQEGLPSRDWVYAGNGSDEVLACAFQAFFGKARPLLFPDITYSFYPVYCALYNIGYAQIPVDDNLNIDFAAYNRPNGGIVFPNPNAPTGQYTPLATIDSLAGANAGQVVLVDEAYVMFSPGSAAQLLQAHANLAVVRTLSKSHSLAGLRCGYILANPKLIAGYAAVKNSFNSYPLDILAQRAAQAAIEDNSHALANCRRVIATRERTAEALRRLGFDVCPSHGNFLLAGHRQYPAAELFASLRRAGILVRHFANQSRIANHLRISVGTDSEMDELIAALAAITGQ